MSYKKYDLRKNAEGYSDPTAYEAIKRADADTARLNKAIDLMYEIAELCGFYVEERIVLRDKRTGRLHE